MKNIVQAFKYICVGVTMFGSFVSQAQVINNIADQSINAYNIAFLSTTGGQTYYKRTLNTDTHDGTWTLALDIFGMQDAYERTGRADHKKLVDDLCNSFLYFNPPPYDWDGWNDDIAWMGLALARGYQITGTANQLTQAKYCFNMAYDRGWNTQFNDGGFWEQQPDKTDTDAATNKQALSNNPMGQLACLIYQITGDAYYLDKAIQIYNWSRSKIFDTSTGKVNAGVFRDDTVDPGTAVYNQGSFIEFTTLLYSLTGDDIILRDAQLAANYVINNMTTNGIIDNTAEYLNTWADTYARGLGHLCNMNPQLWNTYYPFMKANATAAWNNRRTDLNLTWNGWNTQTTSDAAGIPTQYVSAVALFQYTPIVQSLDNTIEAEDYHAMNGMNVEDISANAKSIGSIDVGDWIEYIVNVPAAGVYTLSCNIAATAVGNIEVQQNNIAIGQINFTSSGSMQTYSTSRCAVNLKAGVQSIKLKALTAGWHIDKWSAENCSAIVPAIVVNNGAEQQKNTITINAGDNVSLNPLPANGTWTWSGPAGFTSATRTITINNIQSNKSGVYTAQYQNAEGCMSLLDFIITLNGCTPTAIVPIITANGSTWQSSDGPINAGSYVTMEAQQTDGSWNWIGPDNFKSDMPKISLTSITYKQAGDYTLTHINTQGCKSTKVIMLNLEGADPCSTPVTPYINVNNLEWIKIAYASVTNGGTFTVGPQPFEGTWNWERPNNFTSDTREFTITEFSADKAGHYLATYTNLAGCVTTVDFIVGLDGCTASALTPTITVNDEPWTNMDSIASVSGSNIVITPPTMDGLWSWSGPRGYTLDKKDITFSNITNIREGVYTLSFVDDAACISKHAITINVTGDDYCGSIIEPFIKINSGAWSTESSATLQLSDTIYVGPHPVNNGRWAWGGPDGFSATTREFNIKKIKASQAGIYTATCTNNFGCVSFIDYNISVESITTSV